MRKGWKQSTLGDICNFENGDRGKNYPGKKAFVPSGVPFINAGHLSDGAIEWGSMHFIPYEHFNRLSKGKVGVGDLLFCLRGSLGKFGVVDKDIDGAIASSLVIVRPGRTIDRRFLAAYFRSDLCCQMIHRFANGAAQPNLSVKSLKSFEIPLPPLPEQKRIVAILDEAFAGIATAVANTEKNLANAREMFESCLNAVFSQQRNGWVRKQLREVTTKIGSGATPRGGQSAYKDRGTSLIRSLNVYDRRFKAENLAFIDDAQAARLSNVIVSEGDVLFNITGASVARCCVAPRIHLPARVNQHVAILRPVQSELNSEYLCYLMTSSVYKDRLLGIGDEGGSTRQAITKFQLQNLVIALPVRDEQLRIVEELKSLEIESQRLGYIFEQKCAALAELKQSLLLKAFSGELLKAPQDEPETALA